MTISRSNIPKQITTGGRKMMKKKGYRMGGKIKSKGMKKGGKVKTKISITNIITNHMFAEENAVLPRKTLQSHRGFEALYSCFNMF